ncbi:4Fe-4S binding protein [Mariniflexile sp.]|uniref:4Fe-4S binding protein n=1 Tax=Mariniflexile sp. TaxID=1979402 RepID=UPI003566FE21
MIKNCSLVYFSATKTTKKIVEKIADGINLKNTVHFDITTDLDELNFFNHFNNQLVIIGVPVNAGRVSPEAAKRLKQLKGNGIPAILVVLYGNRGYDDALIELKDIAINQGFKPFAAAAFIGEHSFSNDEYPIAKDRPDYHDLKNAYNFGRQLQFNIKNNKIQGRTVTVPGNHPYKERQALPESTPITNEYLCTECEMCISVCPTGSIALKDKITTDSTTCILCFACVKECSNNARTNESDFVQTIRERTFNSTLLRREPELFLN